MSGGFSAVAVWRVFVASFVGDDPLVLEFELEHTVGVAGFVNFYTDFWDAVEVAPHSADFVHESVVELAFYEEFFVSDQAEVVVYWSVCFAEPVGAGEVPADAPVDNSEVAVREVSRSQIYRTT